MTSVITREPSASGEPIPGALPGGEGRGPAGEAGSVGARMHGLLGAVPTVVLWALVVIWTLPTAGMFVSSFRPGAAVRSTGWWTDIPNPLPDRFGRSLLAAAILFAVGASLAYLVSRLGRRGRLIVAVASLTVAAVWGLLFSEVYPAPYVPVALAMIAAVAVVVGLLHLLSLAFDRLGRTGRVLLVVAIVAAVAAAMVWSATELTMDNYRDVFSTSQSDSPDMWKYFINTAAIAIPATVIPIAFAAFAAYAFAWMDFKGRHWLFIGVVALLAVPFQMSLVPLVQLYNNGAHLTVFGETLTLFPDLDLANSPAAVWLTHIGFGLPLAVFLLHNYIASLPQDVFEAARIDGADHPTIFWRLVLPLSVPALAAFAIFQFLWVWNDYLVARTFLGTASDDAPMTIRLVGLTGSRGEAWHLLTSAAFVSIVVPLIIFFALQRYFVRGLLAGSVKG